MPIPEADRSRLAEATALALAWHAGQSRKGSGAPYASHLLQVAGLVLEHGGSIEQAIAALLHDALEDAASPEERRERERVLAERFGPRVLAMVLDCTDTGPDESLATKAPWRERKSRHLERLASLSAESALVAVCDKLHNLGALVGEVQTQGRGVLESFRGSPAEQVWYFASVAERLQERVPERVRVEYAERLLVLRRLLGD